MTWEFAHAAAIGGRSEQQDRVAIWSDPSSGAVLAVLADGMGGHEGGALAAQCVADAAGELWRAAALPSAEPEELLAQICEAAHRRILQMGQERRLKPGSTCVIFYGDDRAAAWAHVGDSRLYHFRDGGLVGRSRDHSMVQLLVDQGEIGESEMADHPDQNLILQSLGGDRDPKPSFDQARPETGDAFLLCSDGLWEAVSAEEMGEALLAKRLPQAAEALVQKAAARRGTQSDNVSVAMLRRGHAPAARPRAVNAERRGRAALVWAFLAGVLAAVILLGVTAALFRPGFIPGIGTRAPATTQEQSGSKEAGVSRGEPPGGRDEGPSPGQGGEQRPAPAPPVTKGPPAPSPAKEAPAPSPPKPAGEGAVPAQPAEPVTPTAPPAPSPPEQTLPKPAETPGAAGPGATRPDRAVKGRKPNQERGTSTEAQHGKEPAAPVVPGIPPPEAGSN